MLKLENHVVVGSKGILVKLREAESSSVITDDGILVPMYKNFTSDGGKPAMDIAEEKFNYIADVLQISEKATQLLQDEKIDLKVGDVISIYPAYRHPSNYFLIEKDLPYTEHKGYMTLHPNMIQSKIINYNE